MAQSPYEIPAEMRDFAEKSVEQARKAFEGFIGAAQKAVSATETTPFAVPGVKVGVAGTSRSAPARSGTAAGTGRAD